MIDIEFIRNMFQRVIDKIGLEQTIINVIIVLGIILIYAYVIYNFIRANTRKDKKKKEVKSIVETASMSAFFIIIAFVVNLECGTYSYHNTILNIVFLVIYIISIATNLLGRYYLGKSLQGKTPSELVEVKKDLGFYESFNSESKSWVPCVRLSAKGDDSQTSLRTIKINKPIINRNANNNSFDVNSSMKKHELSMKLFNKDAEFNYYSFSDKSLQWGYKKNESFYNNNDIFGLAAYLWIIGKTDKWEDICWLLDFLNKRSMGVWEGLQRNPEELVSEIKQNVPSFSVEGDPYKMKRELQFAWNDLQSFLMFVNYCTKTMGDISGRKVLNLQDCSTFEDIANLICFDMHLRTDGNQDSVNNQDVELPF